MNLGWPGATAECCLAAAVGGALSRGRRPLLLLFATAHRQCHLLMLALALMLMMRTRINYNNVNSEDK